MPINDNYYVGKASYCVYFFLLRYFALGLLYHYNAQDSAALQVCASNLLSENYQDHNAIYGFNGFPGLFCFYKLWIRIVDGELQDSTRSDLYAYIVDFLCTCSNLDLVWKFADWALKKDPTVGYEDVL